MISVFDTNPIIFESDDRTLTISYNGVLCKDANGQVVMVVIIFVKPKQSLLPLLAIN